MSSTTTRKILSLWAARRLERDGPARKGRQREFGPAIAKRRPSPSLWRQNIPDRFSAGYVGARLPMNAAPRAGPPREAEAYPHPTGKPPTGLASFHTKRPTGPSVLDEPPRFLSRSSKGRGPKSGQSPGPACTRAGGATAPVSRTSRARGPKSKIRGIWANPGVGPLRDQLHHGPTDLLGPWNEHGCRIWKNPHPSPSGRDDSRFFDARPSIPAGANRSAGPHLG